MSDLIIEFLKNVNIVQIIAIGVMIWFFYNRLDEKTQKIKEEVKDDSEKNKEELKNDTEKNKEELKKDIEKLGDKVEDVDRRLCRIEGSLSTHGHCLFNQTKPEQKAQ